MSQFPKKCPSCRLVNSAAAMQCKCGHTFVKKPPRVTKTKTLTRSAGMGRTIRTCPQCSSIRFPFSKTCKCGHSFKLVSGTRNQKTVQATKGAFRACPNCNFELRIAQSSMTKSHTCTNCDCRFKINGAYQKTIETEVHIPDTDCYEALGVSPGAVWDKVRKAYLSKISMYHPDKVAGRGKTFTARAELKTLEINAAYQKIKSNLMR